MRYRSGVLRLDCECRVIRGSPRQGREECGLSPGAHWCSEAGKGTGPHRGDRVRAPVMLAGTPEAMEASRSTCCRKSWKTGTEDPPWDLAPRRLLEKSILKMKRGQKPDYSWLQRKGKRGVGHDLRNPTQLSRLSSRPPPPGSLPYGPLPFT